MTAVSGKPLIGVVVLYKCPDTIQRNFYWVWHSMESDQGQS